MIKFIFSSVFAMTILVFAAHAEYVPYDPPPQDDPNKPPALIFSCRVDSSHHIYLHRHTGSVTLEYLVQANGQWTATYSTLNEVPVPGVQKYTNQNFTVWAS